MANAYHSNRYRFEEINFENLREHWHKLWKDNQKIVNTQQFLLTHFNKEKTEYYYDALKKSFANNIARMYTLKGWVRSFGDLTQLSVPYDMFIGPYVNMLLEFVGEIKYWGGVAKNKYKRYQMKHLKFMGDSPVIISMGVNAVQNGNHKLDDDLKVCLKSNMKNGGIVVLNSLGGSKRCDDLAKKFKKSRVCVSAANGAYLSVPGVDGKRVILQNKNISKETAKSLFDYFNLDANKELLKDFYMVVESADENPCVADIYNGTWKGNVDFKKDYATTEQKFRYALTHANNIRFVPKTNKYLIWRLTKDCATESSKNEVLGSYLDSQANKMANLLSALPKDLLDSLESEAAIQLGKNGSVCFVPKGCSKIDAAEQIAAYYDLPNSQIMSLVSSMSDIYDSISVQNMVDFCRANPEANIQDAFMLNPKFLEDQDKFIIAGGEMASAIELNKLNKKLVADVDSVNIIIHKQKLQKIRNELIEKHNKQLESIRFDIAALQAEPETDERKQQIEDLENKIKTTESDFKNILQNFENNANNSAPEKIYSADKYRYLSFKSIASRLKKLSFNEINTTYRASGTRTTHSHTRTASA